MRLLQGHSDAVTCVSLRGRSLVSGGRDRSLVIWEAQPDWRVLRQREYSGEKKFNRKIGVVSINFIFHIPSMLTNFCYFILKTPFLDPSAFRLTAKYSLLLLGCSGVTRSCSTLLRRTRTGVSDFLEVIIDS